VHWRWSLPCLTDTVQNQAEAAEAGFATENPTDERLESRRTRLWNREKRFWPVYRDVVEQARAAPQGVCSRGNASADWCRRTVYRAQLKRVPHKGVWKSMLFSLYVADAIAGRSLDVIKKSKGMVWGCYAEIPEGFHCRVEQNWKAVPSIEERERTKQQKQSREAGR